jgi:hypothetical protein
MLILTFLCVPKKHTEKFVTYRSIRVSSSVAYVAMAIHVCFKCFRLMLQLFHLNIAKVDLDIAYVVMAIHACFKCFVCFRCMLQMFQLDALKVDLGEHMLQWH